MKLKLSRKRKSFNVTEFLKRELEVGSSWWYSDWENFCGKNLAKASPISQRELLVLIAYSWLSTYYHLILRSRSLFGRLSLWAGWATDSLVTPTLNISSLIRKAWIINSPERKMSIASESSWRKTNNSTTRKQVDHSATIVLITINKNFVCSGSAEDGVRLGCYGHEQDGKQYSTHYVADGRGYRLVPHQGLITVYPKDGSEARWL